MAKIGSTHIDNANLIEATNDGKFWCGVGVVVERNGSHFDNNGDVVVEVEMAMTGDEITARLGGPNKTSGIWRIPKVGEEVIVAFPSGQFDWCPTIIGYGNTMNGSDSGVPDDLDETTLVIRNDSTSDDAQKVRISSADSGSNKGSVNIVSNSVNLGVDSPDNSVCRDDKVNKLLTDLMDMFEQWTPVSMDGGAALKALATTLFAKPEWIEIDTACETVKGK